MADAVRFELLRLHLGALAARQRQRREIPFVELVFHDFNHRIHIFIGQHAEHRDAFFGKRQCHQALAQRAMHDMCVAAAAGNASEAVRINRRLTGLHRHLFCEANPIPVKWAVAEMGLMSHGVRLPLTTLTPVFHERIRAAMKQAGL